MTAVSPMIRPNPSTAPGGDRRARGWQRIRRVVAALVLPTA